MWQVLCKKESSGPLAHLGQRQLTPRGPMREMCDAIQVTMYGRCVVTAALEKRTEPGKPRVEERCAPAMNALAGELLLHFP
jgi:hypothetical protein